QLDGATVIPLRKATEPGADPITLGNTQFLPTIELTKTFRSPEGGKNYRSHTQLSVATPAVLEYLGVDPATIDPDTDYLVDRTVTTKDLVIPSFTSGREIPVTHVQKLHTGP